MNLSPLVVSSIALIALLTASPLTPGYFVLRDHPGGVATVQMTHVYDKGTLTGYSQLEGISTGSGVWIGVSGRIAGCEATSAYHTPSFSGTARAYVRNDTAYTVFDVNPKVTFQASGSAPSNHAESSITLNSVTSSGSATGDDYSGTIQTQTFIISALLPGTKSPEATGAASGSSTY